jgi:hypothetical protein
VKAKKEGWKTRQTHSPILAWMPSTCAGRKDIAAKRSWMINKQHLAQLIDLGLVEMRDDAPYLTVAGQNTAWKD